MRDGYIKVAAATPCLRVADVDYNTDEIIRLYREARKKNVSVLVFPELALTGYTASDLFFQDTLLNSTLKGLKRIISESLDSTMLVFVGMPYKVNGKLYNVAAAIHRGAIGGFIAKENIPNYGEFYERRWFTPCPKENIYVDIFDQTNVPLGNKILFKPNAPKSLLIAAEICEDLWSVNPPSVKHAMCGANLIVNLSASDELVGKEEYRRSLIANHSARLVSGYIYANAGEGESTTDMVFTGNDFIAENGTILASSNYNDGNLLISEIDIDMLNYERSRISTYPDSSSVDDEYDIINYEVIKEDVELTRFVDPHPFVPADEALRSDRCEKILTLQAMGLKKRLKHTNAKCAVIGLSGGLDSTLALLVTVRAFDMLSKPREEIIAITMPCFGTTKRTNSNAELLASALGVTVKEVNLTKSVLQHFEDIGHDKSDLSVTYENGQARERTQVLMDIANKNGGLVIGTGDLSELALGWATYNGDHMSMYGVNGSVPKTLVRYLVEYAASKDEKAHDVLIDILNTPVSPELLPAENGEISQKTEDIVGPYELHDFFLYYFVRKAFPPHKIYRLALIAFDGVYSSNVIRHWLIIFVKRFFSQQFKRSCLPDGPKVGTITLSPRSDWRMSSDSSYAIWLEDANSIPEV